METEHTKPTNNDHVENIQGDESEPQHTTVSLPPIPPRETDADQNRPTRNRNLSPEVDIPPMQSPMGPPGYDPARIPTSIFSSKPTNPAEWSVTSNESLFSIHMGNNSFSRDYAILFGKSGELPDWNELPRLDEWSPNNNTIPKPSDSPVMELPLMGNQEKEVEKEDVESSIPIPKEEKPVINSQKVSPEKSHQSPPEKRAVPAPNHPPAYQRPPENRVVPAPNHPPPYQSPPEKKVVPAPNHPPAYQSPPRFSSESGNSCSSFAFPVLVSESRKPESLKVVPKQPEPPRDPKENPRKKRWCSFHMCFCCCWRRCCCC